MAIVKSALMTQTRDQQEKAQYTDVERRKNILTSKKTG